MNRTDFSAPGTLPPTPIPNSYWVEPGRLLAGEYPGRAASRGEVLDRIQALLRAGVNSFIDLTDARELPPYDALLSQLANTPVEYRRCPIVDHGLPESPKAMAAILDAIAEQLAAGRCVYVHCRAGIGRTGMTMACHLIRSGLDNEAALDQLQLLWRQCARSEGWPYVPETQEQIQFVRNWREPAQHAAPTAGERRAGAFLGLSVGEALGIALAGGLTRFNADGSIPAATVLVPGADTAMTQSVAASLLQCGGHRPEDQMQRYGEFIRTGQHTETGIAAANLSPELKRAVAAWQWSRKANAGTHDPKNLDPHSLARSLAVAAHSLNDPAAAIALAVEVSRTTQQSPVVLDAVRVWTALIIDALSGVDKARLLDLRHTPSMQIVLQRPLRKELAVLLEGRWAAFAPNDGGALAVIARTLSALNSSEEFGGGLQQLFSSPVALSAVGLPAVATAGALFGALAGALYGVDAIPQAWRQAPALRDFAQGMAG